MHHCIVPVLFQHYVEDPTDEIEKKMVAVFEQTYFMIKKHSESEKFYKERKFPEATIKFKEAADLGLAKAQINYGLCLFDGVGVKPNQAEAVIYYQKAADQKDHEAENLLGLCYLYGYGVDPNYNKAEEWFKKAENHSSDITRKNLSSMGRNGCTIQ